MKIIEFISADNFSFTVIQTNIDFEIIQCDESTGAVINVWKELFEDDALNLAEQLSK